MIIDATDLADGQRLAADICVVGSGPAGLALAQTLEGSGLEVILLESGGLAPEPRPQRLNRAINGGLPYFPLDANRQRAFGGTSHLWAGWCRPLDPIDLSPRAWVPESGWPFGCEALEPYIDRAARLLGLESSGRDASEPPEQPDSDFGWRTFQLAPPDEQRQAAARALRASSGIRVVLHATVTEIETTEAGSSVVGLSVRSPSGASLVATARLYVVAAGGIESARLLLASRRARPAGVGNEHDLVGRYFMEHIVFEHGAIEDLRPRALPHGAIPRPGSRTVARLFPSDRRQHQDQMLRACTQLLPLGGRFSDLASRLAAPVLATARVHTQRWSAHGLPRVRVRRAIARHLGGRHRPPMMPPRRVRLLHVMEQAPNRESRVALARERDALGMPRVRLAWRTLPIDEHTAGGIRRFAREACEAGGLGVFRLEPEDRDAWPPSPLQGQRGHHMGTTRMHIDPKRGVVDADCRVHGARNLFVASSSVFPTSGAGVPTMTIVALAIRLGDHLRRLIRERALPLEGS